MEQSVRKNKIKIFVSAYACEPGFGSEIGVGWHWVLEMSKYFDLWVLTRKSNQARIENWIEANNKLSNVQFIYYDLPYYLRFWKKGLRGVRTYYNIWQFATNSIVRHTMRTNNINIFHHLTYGNALWKVSSFGQKQFFIWGPIGGVETIPLEYSKYYNPKNKIIELIRREVVKHIRFNLSFKDRCKNANLILCKTEITKALVTQHKGTNAILFTDVATSQIQIKETLLSKSEKIEYLIIGRLDPWRGFDLAIEAFALALNTSPNIHLSIVGEGSDRKRLESLITKNNIAPHVSFIGAVSMDMYYALMQRADVIINTSLKEGAVTVSFDSMSMGKPLICVDTGGYTRSFSNDYAIVIPLEGREKLISDLSQAILSLTDENKRNEMGQKSQTMSKNNSWETKGEQIYELITNSYQQYVDSKR